jgi:hypothetical protein
MITTLDETGHVEIILPACHWCGQEIDGPSRDGMHLSCAEEFVVEWDLVAHYNGQSIQRIEE